MNARPVIAVLLLACGTAPAAVRRQGADTVELSTGHIVRIAYNGEISTDQTGKKASGENSVVFFESSSGSRLAMKSQDNGAGRVQTSIWSVGGHDRVEFEIDLEFGRKGLPDPLVVTINGVRTPALLNRTSVGGDDKLRDQLRPDVARLSAGFIGALKELFRLGQAGYPNIGSGWADILFLFDPSELATAEILSRTAMGQQERDSFVGGFSK